MDEFNDVEAMKQKFNSLTTHKKHTGDPNCPTPVTEADKAQKAFNDSAQLLVTGIVRERRRRRRDENEEHAGESSGPGISDVQRCSTARGISDLPKNLNFVINNATADFTMD
jgi:hypothetical protein